MFLRDKADKNILLDEVQFTDDEANLAAEMAVSAFNAVTPQTYFTPVNFPEHLKYILLIGTARFLMMSEAFLQIRNQANYQDGDVQGIGLDDKQAAYANLAQVIKAEFDELTRNVKMQNNMESMYKGFGSGYRNTSRFS